MLICGVKITYNIRKGSEVIEKNGLIEITNETTVGQIIGFLGVECYVVVDDIKHNPPQLTTCIVTDVTVRKWGDGDRQHVAYITIKEYRDSSFRSKFDGDAIGGMWRIFATTPEAAIKVFNESLEQRKM